MKMLGSQIPSHDPQRVYVKNLAFSPNKKELYASIGDLFVALDRSTFVFRTLKISNTFSPHQWGSSSPDNHYIVSNEKDVDVSNTGFPKELWVHDFASDTSRKIQTLSDDQTFMSSVELDVGVGEVNTSSDVKWINDHVFEYSIYDSQTDVISSYREFKLIERHRYDIVAREDSIIAL